MSTNVENLRILAEACEVNTVLGCIGHRWMMQILFCISQDVYQFSKLKRVFPTLSDQVLGKRINELQENALIVKLDIPNTNPQQIRYEITEKGKELLKVVQDLHQWGLKWSK